MQPGERGARRRNRFSDADEMLGEFAIVAADFGTKTMAMPCVRHRSQWSGGHEPRSWRLAHPVAAAAGGLR